LHNLNIKLTKIANFQWRGKVLEIYCYSKATRTIAKKLREAGYTCEFEIAKAAIDAAYPTLKSRKTSIISDCKKAMTAKDKFWQHIRKNNNRWWSLLYQLKAEWEKGPKKAEHTKSEAAYTTKQDVESADISDKTSETRMSCEPPNRAIFREEFESPHVDSFFKLSSLYIHHESREAEMMCEMDNQALFS